MPQNDPGSQPVVSLAAVCGGDDVLCGAEVGDVARALEEDVMEWLAKIALYFLLGGWSGTVLLATDSTAALTANLTRAPRNGTLLLLPFRTALV